MRNVVAKKNSAPEPLDNGKQPFWIVLHHLLQVVQNIGRVQKVVAVITSPIALSKETNNIHSGRLKPRVDDARFADKHGVFRLD